MISDKFVILGAAAELWGCLIYSRDTLAGRTKPNRVTWFLWSLAPALAFAAEINKGVSFFIALMTLSVVIGPLLVLISSFMNPKAYWRLKLTDYICGLLSLAGLALWLIYNEANVAIIFAIAADGFAAIPTLIKSFKYPQTESLEAYTTAVFNAGVALLAINHWTLANYGFPTYILIFNIIFVLLIKFKFGLRLRGRTV